MSIHEAEFTGPSQRKHRHTIRFPRTGNGCDQHEEWFEVFHNGAWRRMRIHDYPELFSIPGLYEALVYKTLKCTSPRRIVRLLAQVLEDWPQSPEDLRVLDLGAGNGIVAQRLRKAGVGHITGIDLIKEAAAAAERDRPGVYDDYVVADLCNLNDEQAGRLREARCNSLVTVAALGFGDIPPRAFSTAMNFVSNPGWVAMTLKDTFLSKDDASGFSRLIRRMMAERILEVQAQFRYCHRLSLAGEQLFYVGLIARKLRDVPESLVAEVERPQQNQISSNGPQNGSQKPKGNGLIVDTLERSSS